MAVMAREVGLPARVAGGYLPGIIDPLTGAHIVRAGDAHAWVEIHFERQGWVAFDPTPRADSAMGFIGKRSLIRFGLEDLTSISIAGAFTPLKGSFSLGSLSASIWLWGMLFIGVAIIVWMAFRFRKRMWKTGQASASYSSLEGESRKMVLGVYRRMITVIARKGLAPRQPYQPPEEYAAVVLPDIPAGQEIVQHITNLASRAAYDPSPFNAPDVKELNQSLSDLKRALATRRTTLS
jgi:hypothetical protein